MIQTALTAVILYTATALDLLVILLIYFARAQTKREYRDIYIGQFLGSGALPEKWMLGLLGIIPLYLGIKVALFDDCEGEARAKRELDKKGLSKLVGIVALVTLASCGADNIGLFVPYFVSSTLAQVIVTLIVFVIMIFLLVFSAQKLAKVPGIGETVEKYNRWIMAIIYIGLGLYILIENKTIQTLLSFVS